jgi:hypothetical protein
VGFTRPLSRLHESYELYHANKRLNKRELNFRQGCDRSSRKPLAGLSSDTVRSILEIIGGFLLVLIGILGIILPIMPGWIFLIPGLVLLAQHFDWAKQLVVWAKEKAANAAEAMRKDRRQEQEPPQNP